MGHFDEEHQPDELQDLARRLRDRRPEASPLDLDRIKMRAMAGATTSRSKGSTLKSRLIVALCTVGLMAGTTGGVIAASGGSKAKGSAQNSQYKGKKCGKTDGSAGPKKPNQKPCPPQAGPKK